MTETPRPESEQHSVKAPHSSREVPQDVADEPKNRQMDKKQEPPRPLASMVWMEPFHPLPLWLRAIPFFMGGMFFLSAFFSVFTPLPLMVLFFRASRKWAWLGLLTNFVLVWIFWGGVSGGVYLVVGGVSAIILCELFSRAKSLEFSIGVVFAIMVVTSAIALWGAQQLFHLNLIDDLQTQINLYVDQIVQTQPELLKGLPEGAGIDAIKQRLWSELPAAAAIFVLVMLVLSSLLVLRMNPRGIRLWMGLDSIFHLRWKAPEWLVWPTILFGFLYLLELPVGGGLVWTSLKFLMTIYVFQGLSILLFWAYQWKLSASWRVLTLIFSLVVMMPLVLSLGFFDLWFDFRGKFRQS